MAFCFTLANTAQAQNILVKQAYIRATIPGTDISSAYMTIINDSSKPMILVGASGDFSKRIEIHQHIMADGMMKMRQQESLTIAANSKVVLQPMGYHLMIFDLTKPLKAGEQSTLTLHFANSSDIKIVLPVESIKRKKTTEHHH